MFKKLKEKITEEVRSSPQRLQQLTQSVSDKLQGTNSSDENFFSIGDEDASTPNMSTVDQGFSSVALVSPTSEEKLRRSSISSLASDISFLPKYDAANMYHLQSDMDVSASELEDNISQSSSNVGRVSKEQLYSAFKKSQMQYHKYRGRYTDLARHYKEIEREMSKMKAVLVETQDKAIRRVTELKEQCSLEQKAKAHLESALRDELDEKEMKIQSLQTKIDLLQGPNAAQNPITIDKLDLSHAEADKLEQLTKYLNDARSEIEALNQEHKASTIIFQTKEQEYKMKIVNLEKDISSLYEREKENNIKLAENKMELHNELLSKDAEINKMKKEIESLKVSLSTKEKEEKNTKLENLQSQNGKLIEKIENLTQKCNGFEHELLKVETYKMEIQKLTEQNSILTKNADENISLSDNISKLTAENNGLRSTISDLKTGLNNIQENFKILSEEKNNLIQTIEKEKKEYETQIENLRYNAKQGLFSLEKQILERMKTTYDEKEKQLRNQFNQKIEEITSNNKELKEIHLQLIDKENIIKRISEEFEELKNKLRDKENKFDELERNHLELIDECSKLRTTTNLLETQINEVTNQKIQDNEDKKNLQDHIKTLEDEVNHIQKICKDKEENNVQLSTEILKLQNTNRDLLEKVRLVEEKQEMAEMIPTENNLLEMKIHKLEEEKLSLLNDFEKERKILNEMIKENKEVKIKDVKISELNDVNHKLEEKICKLKEYLKAKEDSIVELNKNKFNLEQEVIKLKESVRILEEHEEAIELDKTECNLLQIKVQQLEKEKENLLKSFENEREIFDHTFHKTNQEFDTHKEEIMNENVSLAKENLELKKSYEELKQKVRIFEERDEVIELEKSEAMLLKLKLQQLETEKSELLNSFEMEREMFNKILIEHKELKLKEEQIKELEDSNKHLTERLAEFKGFLKKKDGNIVDLQKAKLTLEQDIAKLKESLRIKEEEVDAISVEKTECELLQLKLQALQEEKQNLLNSFEIERKTFEEETLKTTHIENSLEKLNEENSILRSEVDTLIKDNKIIQEKYSSLYNDQNENVDIINEQKQLISNLNSEIDELRSNHETEKNKNNHLVNKLSDLTQEIDGYKIEKEEVKKTLQAFENRIEEVKRNAADRVEEKIKELEVLVKEKSVLETELRKKIEQHNFKSKEMGVIQQQFNVLMQEKENVLSENKHIKMQLEELKNANFKSLESKVKELEQAKELNKVIQNVYDKLNQEVSELKIRINQLTSDNKNVHEEYEKLVMELEGHKARNAFLEKEKLEFEEKTEKTEKHTVALQDKINDLAEQLHQIKKDSKDVKPSSTDLEDIQKDFYDLKEKCDNLFVENKNLKQEYTRIQEQCDNFNKIKQDLEKQVADLEGHYNEVLHEKQLLQDEVQELKISPINSGTSVTSNGTSKLENLNIVKQETLLNAVSNEQSTDSEKWHREFENLTDKLAQYKSLDVTNKSSIEFYENELQKQKNKNEKLNRKLDETLVTLSHCAELSNSTEIEYLRNVLYNYMLGKESLVLARVIAAVCKFDPNQTEAVLQKEQQKQTLLGQLGLL